MEARIRNEIERFLHQIDVAHREILGDAYKLITKEQHRQLQTVFSNAVEEVIALAKKGKNVHERFLQNLVINSIDAIIGLDNDSRIFFWNRGAEIIFGYPAQEIVGKSFSVLVPQNRIDTGELEQLQEETIRVGFVRDFVTERIRKDGKKIVISLSRTLVRDEEQHPLGFVAVIRDITETVELQKQIQQSEKLSLVGQLAAGIAHEVGTPLNIISGSAQYLMLEKKSSDPESEELTVIVNQIERINKLIQKLLTFARPQHVVLEELNLVDQINSVTALLHNKIETTSIRLQVTIDPRTPVIRADRNQLQQIFLNILVNACDAFNCDMKNRSKEIRITVYPVIDEKDSKRYLAIEFQDSGCGISDEKLPFIFDPFFTTKEVGKGTGLGLAVSKRIVEDNGGSISVTSVVDAGTTFTVRLPI